MPSKQDKKRRAVNSLAQASAKGIEVVERITSSAMRTPHPILHSPEFLDEIFIQAHEGLEVASEVKRKRDALILEAGLKACMGQALALKCFESSKTPPDDTLEETYRYLKESAELVLPWDRKTAGNRFELSGFFSKKNSMRVGEERDEPWLKREKTDYERCWRTLKEWARLNDEGEESPEEVRKYLNLGANAISQAGYAAWISGIRKGDNALVVTSVEYFDHFLGYYKEKPSKNPRIKGLIRNVRRDRDQAKRFLTRVRT